jgi:hypothetical protein
MKSKGAAKATSPAATPKPKRYSRLNAYEQQANADYEWCLHDADVRRQYSGKVVVAHGKRILGWGSNHLEAWQSAVRNGDCPSRDQVAVVFVPEAAPYSI